MYLVKTKSGNWFVVDKDLVAYWQRDTWLLTYLGYKVYYLD
jgi:hypothetical protein